MPAARTEKPPRGIRNRREGMRRPESQEAVDAIQAGAFDILAKPVAGDWLVDGTREETMCS